MNEEQLIEFINWLPTAVPEFQDASPEQIVQTLNQLYESEEGQATLSQLFTAFQESKNEPQSQMFKKGGKLDQLINKAKKGKKMCCKKKEIVQGGMANKVAEKMQNPQTFAQAFASARKEGLDEFTWRGNKYNTLTKEEAAALPMVDSRYSDALYRDFWNKKFPSNYVEKQQQGGEFDNPIERNATLSTLDILNSTRPFIQQNVTPNETREFYAYSRDRLPDNVGGTGNFEGAIRTITPRDTTVSYQLPGLAIYTAASSKDRGPRWKEMNSKMDSIKNKANNQKNK